MPRSFQNSTSAFLHLHASGKYWDQESYIVWAIKQTSQKHYDTISSQVIQKFPISKAYRATSGKRTKSKKENRPKPEMKLYDLPDRHIVYIGKFK